MRLRDKVAIVTGASKGLGPNMAAEGAAVVVNYASKWMTGETLYISGGLR